MMKSNKINDEKEVKEEKKSFFEKIKTDKKYSAKVQLIGYGVLIVALVIYLNIASMGSSVPGNSTLDSGLDSNVQDSDTEEDTTNLLEKIDNNYQYDVTVYIQNSGEENQEIAGVSQVRYVGKAYDNKVEMTKEDDISSSLYYKVDNLYYNKNDEGMSLIDEEIIYDVIDSEYVELEDILNLIDKASLDHVTNYSSGRKEYVYHLKVKDVIVSYKLEDVAEIQIEEENGVLKMAIDYTNLLKVIDESILECKLEATITDIGKVEEFVVLEEENTSEE